MKNNIHFSLLIFLMTFLTASSQDTYSSARAFINLEMMKDQNGASAYYVFPNGWSPFFRFMQGDIEAKNLPDDYNPGSTFSLFLGSGISTLPIPEDHYKGFVLGMGRSFFPAWDRGFLMATAGLGATTHGIYQFTPYIPDPNFNPFLTNYQKDKLFNTSMALDLGVMGSINLYRWVGVGGGAHANISGQRTILRPYASLLIGKMRERKD